MALMKLSTAHPLGSAPQPILPPCTFQEKE
jgi:hypothetical protein